MTDRDSRNISDRVERTGWQDADPQADIASALAVSIRRLSRDLRRKKNCKRG